MTPGFVYILTNESMPGLVKIGRTCRDVDLRASELWQTGVPTKFDVFASERTCDCVQLEAYIHGDLRKRRVNRSREFFAIDPEAALRTVQFWAEFQAGEFVREHFDGVLVVPWQEWIDGSRIEGLMEETGLDASIIRRAMAMVSSEELAPAIARAQSERNTEHIEALCAIGVPEAEWEAMLNG